MSTPRSTNHDRLTTTHWLVIVALAVAGTAWLVRPPGPASIASAQNQPVAGGRGVFAFTGQLDRDTFGLFMLDVDTETIWCYELVEGRRGAREMRLVAARSFEFDRYLKNYNSAPPNFRDVRQLIELERQTMNEAQRWLDVPPTADHDTNEGTAVENVEDAVP